MSEATAKTTTVFFSDVQIEKIILLQLVNIIFVIAAAARVLQPGTAFTAYFIIVSMAVSIGILFFLNFTIFSPFTHHSIIAMLPLFAATNS